MNGITVHIRTPHTGGKLVESGYGSIEKDSLYDVLTLVGGEGAVEACVCLGKRICGYIRYGSSGAFVFKDYEAVAAKL